MMGARGEPWKPVRTRLQNNLPYQRNTKEKWNSRPDFKFFRKENSVIRQGWFIYLKKMRICTYIYMTIIGPILHNKLFQSWLVLACRCRKGHCCVLQEGTRTHQSSWTHYSPHQSKIDRIFLLHHVVSISQKMAAQCLQSFLQSDKIEWAPHL